MAVSTLASSSSVLPSGAAPRPVSRRSFLGAPAAALASGCSSFRARPPNVVIVITDDQGYGDLACHGNPWLRTPNLDLFHDDSVRLTDFHVDPLCAPTRAALLTGRYAFRTGVTAAYAGRSILRRDEVTLADVLAAAGYRTGLFGKWHLGDNWPYRPNERGFDETVVCWSGGVTQAADWWGNDYFDDIYYRNNDPERFEGYCTDVFFDEGLRFIERNASGPLRKGIGRKASGLSRLSGQAGTRSPYGNSRRQPAFQSTVVEQRFGSAHCNPSRRFPMEPKALRSSSIWMPGRPPCKGGSPLRLDPDGARILPTWQGLTE